MYTYGNPSPQNDPFHNKPPVGSQPGADISIAAALRDMANNRAAAERQAAQAPSLYGHRSEAEQALSSRLQAEVVQLVGGLAVETAAILRQRGIRPDKKGAMGQPTQVQRPARGVLGLLGVRRSVELPPDFETIWEMHTSSRSTQEVIGKGSAWGEHWKKWRVTTHAQGVVMNAKGVLLKAHTLPRSEVRIVDIADVDPVHCGVDPDPVFYIDGPVQPADIVSYIDVSRPATSQPDLLEWRRRFVDLASRPALPGLFTRPDSTRRF